MNNDLISRKELLNQFSRNNVYKHITNAEGKNILEMVQDAPTAYDLDKVVEKLEKNRKEAKEYRCDQAAGAYEISIEIIKAGGANE